MAEVRLENVTKFYGRKVAVNDVSFTFREGEFFSIVGPTGAGKSTILKMITGIEPITSGKMYFNDQVVNEALPQERNVSMAFETYNLYPHFSVYENIAFPLKASGMSKTEVAKNVEEIAEVFDLVSILKKKPSELAGGHQQRVSLARALVRKPKLTLLDEPISHMDQRVRAEIRARIRKIHNELGNTTIYVTHDQAEAISLCDRLLILHQAELQQIGTVEEIWNQPKTRFVAHFVGERAMDFIDGKVDGPQQVSIQTTEGKRTFEFKGEIDLKYIGADITVGVRPQED